MENVRFENGYKVTSTPVLVTTYKNGCPSKKQKTHTKFGRCGNVETPIFHETWEAC